MRPLIAYSLFIFIFTACSSQKPEKTKSDKPLSDSLVNRLQTAPVALEDMEDVIRLNGKVTPTDQQQSKVFALVSGRVGAVNVELGDYVKKGQLLALLQSTEVAGVNNDLSLAEANLEIARKNMETKKSLFESSLLTEQEYLIAKQEYNKAQSEYKKASQVSSITGGGTTSGYMLKAPIAGTVIEKNISSHSEIRQDNDNALFTIADLSTVWIIANAFEQDIPDIHLGDPVKVTTLANREKSYTGRIDKIYNVLDAENRTMKVRISMNNEEQELKPEMFARVYLTSRSKGGRKLCVPAKAVVLDNNKRYVIVKKDTGLEIREISLIKRINDLAFVEGVEEGERVVTESQVFIYDALNVK